MTARPTTRSRWRASYGDAVRVFTHPNMGVERTSNRGVEEARGEYTAFLSADDLYEPTYVEELYAALVAVPEASFAYCRAQMFGADDRILRAFPFSPYLIALRTNYVNACALTRRADYLAVGGMSDVGDITMEDWDLWLRMMEQASVGRSCASRSCAGAATKRAAGTPTPACAPPSWRCTERHDGLRAKLRGPRARLRYLFDLAVAALDIVVGLSRWPLLVRWLERSSWRSFERQYRR